MFSPHIVLSLPHEASRIQEIDDKISEILDSTALPSDKSQAVIDEKIMAILGSQLPEDDDSTTLSGNAPPVLCRDVQ